MVAEYVQLQLLVTVVGTKHIALRWMAERWCTYESPLRKSRVLSPSGSIRSGLSTWLAKMKSRLFGNVERFSVFSV